MNSFRHFGKTPWKSGQPISRLLPAQNNITQKIADTSMPRAEFEPTISVFERSRPDAP